MNNLDQINMLVLSIISLAVSIGALVLALILWKKVSQLRFDADTDASLIKDLDKDAKRLSESLSALEKQVKVQSLTPIEKPAETEKKPTTIGGLENVVYYNTKSKTVTLSANLLVKGAVTATKAREE